MPLEVEPLSRQGAMADQIRENDIPLLDWVRRHGVEMSGAECVTNVDIGAEIKAESPGPWTRS